MDITLADYIKRITEKDKVPLPMTTPTVPEQQDQDQNQYPVYPEDDGTDRPINPYSPV